MLSPKKIGRISGDVISDEWETQSYSNTGNSHDQHGQTQLQHKDVIVGTDKKYLPNRLLDLLDQLV